MHEKIETYFQKNISKKDFEVTHEHPIIPVKGSRYLIDFTLKKGNKIIPVEVKKRTDRGLAFQVMKYIRSLKLLGHEIPEARIIVGEVTPELLLGIYEHNEYNPTKIKIYIWTLNKKKQFEIYEYKSIYKTMKELVEAHKSDWVTWQ